MSSDPLSPGLREELITRVLHETLAAIDAGRVERRELEQAEARPYLAKHLAALTAEWLATNATPDRAALVNQLAEQLGGSISLSGIRCIARQSCSQASGPNPVDSPCRHCRTAPRSR